MQTIPEVGDRAELGRFLLILTMNQEPLKIYIKIQAVEANNDQEAYSLNGYPFPSLKRQGYFAERLMQNINAERQMTLKFND